MVFLQEARVATTLFSEPCIRAGRPHNNTLAIVVAGETPYYNDLNLLNPNPARSALRIGLTFTPP